MANSQEMQARIDRSAKRIMRKLKGWRAKDAAEDRRDHPEAHAYELNWTKRQLSALCRPLRAAHALENKGE
jgi:hypothetical protein